MAEQLPDAAWLRQLNELLPGACTGDAADIDKLRRLLEESAQGETEAFRLTWPGKADAYKTLDMPPVAVLIPQPNQSVQWDGADHLFIEGENSEALKLLLPDYAGKVGLIYIDPPYNSGSGRFSYRDKFSAVKGRSVKNVPKEAAAHHAAWLSMMLPRLSLARDLLRDDGLIFISIDDHEVHHLRLLLDEVFGEGQFVASLVWRRRKTQANLSRLISPVHDYILCYAKDIGRVKLNKLAYGSAFIDKTFSNPDGDPRGPYQTRPLAQPDSAPNAPYELELPTGRKITARWSCSPETFQRYLQEARLFIPKKGRGMPRLKIFLSELEGFMPNTWLDDVATNEEGSRELERWFGSNAFFISPKPTRLIRHLLQLGTGPEDIVLDFFAGSGTTAEAVLDQNQADGGRRKFICIQQAEPLRTKGLPYRQGYRHIAEICLRRIQLVLEEKNRQGAAQGCRVYRVAAPE